MVDGCAPQPTNFSFLSFINELLRAREITLHNNEPLKLNFEIQVTLLSNIKAGELPEFIYTYFFLQTSLYICKSTR